MEQPVNIATAEPAASGASLLARQIRIFWASPDRTVPRVRVIEMAPIMFLLFICAAQTVWAGPVIRFMQTAAESLHAPAGYVSDVLQTGAEASQQVEGK